MQDWPEFTGKFFIAVYVATALCFIYLVFRDYRVRNGLGYFTERSRILPYFIGGVALLMCVQFYRATVCGFLSSKDLCIGSVTLSNCENGKIALDCVHAANASEKDLHDYELAKNFWKQACDLKIVSACSTLGVRYGRERDLLKGIFYSEKACEMGEPVGCLNSACYFSIMRQAGKSADALDRAIRKGYKNWEWIMKDEDLQYLRSSSEFQVLHKKYHPSVN